MIGEVIKVTIGGAIVCMLYHMEVAGMGSKALDYTALAVAVIGAVNWGLIGLFRLDLVALLFGQMSWISRIVYVLVGICGIYLLTFFGRIGNGIEE